MVTVEEPNDLGDCAEEPPTTIDFGYQVVHWYEPLRNPGSSNRHHTEPTFTAMEILTSGSKNATVQSDDRRFCISEAENRCR